MVQTIEQGDIFGRIGKSFGEGLGDQIPKSYKAKRLSEDLGKINPRLGDLYKNPLMLEHPEIAAQAAKFIKSDISKDINKDLDDKSVSRTIKNNNVFSSQDQGGTEIKGDNFKSSRTEESSDIPPAYDRNASNYLIPTDPQILYQQASEISDEHGIPFEEALGILESRDAKRVNAEKDFEERNSLGEKELDKSVEEFLQKPGNEIYNDITGKMKQQYRTLVANDISNGQSPIQSARKRGNELLRMAETRQQISTEAAKNVYGTSRAEAQRIVKGLRDEYKKNDALGLYQEDLIGKLKMQPAFASTLAFPVTANENIVKQVKGYRKNPIEFTKKILKDLNGNDSLQSIALAIEENAGRGAGKRFLENVSAEKSAGKLDKLTERQIKELGYEFNPNPSLRDVYYTSLFGKRSGV